MENNVYIQYELTLIHQFEFSFDFLLVNSRILYLIIEFYLQKWKVHHQKKSKYLITQQQHELIFFLIFCLEHLLE